VGAASFKQLGFSPTLQLRRLRLENSTPPKSAAPRSNHELSQFIARDDRAMGFDRSALLAELGGRSGSRLVSNSDAMALVRDGRKIRHIGPLLAGGSASALAIVDEIVGSETGSLLLDAVSTHDGFLKRLTGSGWIAERPFQRMRFGRATALPTELPFAVAGPEYG